MPARRTLWEERAPWGSSLEERKLVTGAQGQEGKDSLFCPQRITISRPESEVFLVSAKSWKGRDSPIERRQWLKRTCKPSGPHARHPGACKQLAEVGLHLPPLLLVAPRSSPCSLGGTGQDGATEPSPVVLTTGGAELPPVCLATPAS